ncbi:MAG: hypothetical protein ACI86H_000198 [bacterium]
MTTLEKKAVKPKIFTESDRIIDHLTDELKAITTRVSDLEGDREDYKEFFDQFNFQKELSNEILESSALEKQATRENFEVLAGVMHKWKNPVSNVVTNLENIVSGIDDLEMKESLRECMNTASQVLDSFNQAEEFCEQASRDGEFESTTLEPRKYFKSKISSLQSNDHSKKHKYRLLIEKNVPQKIVLNEKILGQVSQDLWNELEHYLEPNNICFRLGVRSGGSLFGFDTEDFLVSFEAEKPSELIWASSISEILKVNEDILKNTGLRWLQVADRVRKIGGRVEIMEKTGKVTGCRLLLPLTSSE